jgi:exodeoxyribonuclease V alpha subunit
MPQVKAPEDPEAQTDFYVIPAESPEDIQDKLLRVVTERIPKRFGLHPIRDIQVLTPMNGARSVAGPSTWCFRRRSMPMPRRA